MLVAFYAKKQTKIAYLVGGRTVTKTIPANTWTIFEEITETAQILNTAALDKGGVTTYAAAFKSTPPFGNSGKVAVFAANSDTARVGIFAEFKGASADAAAEIAAGRVSQFDSKVEKTVGDTFTTAIIAARTQFLNKIADAKKVYEESAKGGSDRTTLQNAVQNANASFLNRLATLNSNYVSNVFNSNFDAATNSIIAGRIAADRVTFGAALAAAVADSGGA